MIPASPPTLPEVRERLKLPADIVSDEELQDILLGEESAQQAACRTDPYPAELRLALFRRCLRAVAARGVPLGILADEYGQSYLRGNDSEITRLERPYMPFRMGGRAPEVTHHGRA